MIRRCHETDFDMIWEIINDGARAYRGVIPEDRWKEPYLSRTELQHEISEGVEFWGFAENGVLTAVMGMQPLEDVTLIRHAYVRCKRQRQGIGGRLLSHLLSTAERPTLIGTWADATWAIRFYQKHGFQLVPSEQKGRLLRRYWTIPERQIATSIVLADTTWQKLNPVR